MRNHRCQLAILVFCVSVQFGGTAGAASRQILIGTGDVAALMAAVADPANSGAELVLAPGVYALVQPLVLAPNMKLVGANQYQDLDGDGVWDARDTHGTIFADPATQTVLDASRVVDRPVLLTCHLQSIEIVTVEPLIQLTTGNEVRNLTILGSRWATISPTFPGAAWSGGGDFKVTGVIVIGAFTDTTTGISARHHGCTLADAYSDAIIESNVFLNNQVAIEFANFLAPSARWHGRVRNNRVIGSGIGMSLQAGIASDNSELSVVSAGNIFERGGLGVLVRSGRELSFNFGRFGGSGNRLEWVSRGDAIWNNVGRGGIEVVGSSMPNPTAIPLLSNNNELRLTLLDTRFVNPDSPPGGANSILGMRVDMVLSGGRAGTGNTIRTLMRQASSDGASGSFLIVDTPGNTVSVVGSDVAFEHANDNVSPVAEP